MIPTIRLPLVDEGPISESMQSEDILQKIADARMIMGGESANLYPRIWATILPRATASENQGESQQQTPRSQLLAKRTASYEGNFPWHNIIAAFLSSQRHNPVL